LSTITLISTKPTIITSHFIPLNTKKKRPWHWKFRTWLGTGTKMWWS